MCMRRVERGIAAREDAAAVVEILAARQRSRAGPVTLGPAGRPAATVGKVLRRRGHSRRPRVQRPRVVRYARAQPGEFVLVTLGRAIGVLVLLMLLSASLRA